MVLSVSDIDFKTGLLTVTFNLQLAWRDPGIVVCNCIGNEEGTEHLMDSSFGKKIWTPSLHLLDNIFFEDDHSKRLMVVDYEE